MSQGRFSEAFQHDLRKWADTPLPLHKLLAEFGVYWTNSHPPPETLVVRTFLSAQNAREQLKWPDGYTVIHVGLALRGIPGWHETRLMKRFGRTRNGRVRVGYEHVPVGYVPVWEFEDEMALV